jgi:membrane protein YdbS with pleckstrin-like domain
MTEEDRLARNRYYIIAGTNLLATAGAVLGLLIAGRSATTEYTVFGCVVLLGSLYMMAVVPRWLARRWRTPPQP